MEQAQRLQEISATLLDTMPVASPIGSNLNAGVRADLSFLPSPNPRVGAKVEALPSAPVQAIRTLFGSAGLMFGGFEAIAAEGWAGVLPKGTEKLLGIKAALIQYQYGARAEISSTRMGAARFVLGAGLTRTQSDLTGTISSTSGSDVFKSDSLITFASTSVQHVRSGLWGALMIGRKKTTSRLTITEDQTDLEVVDTLSSARQPHWTQVSLGFNLSKSFSFALSELMVPDRLEMPRITFAWNLLSPSGAPRE